MRQQRHRIISHSNFQSAHNNQLDNMGRGKAWFCEADMNLAQAWSQASHDPIVGNMQDGKSFWQTIKTNFMKLSKTNEERSLSSLQSRWSDINKRTSKFNGTVLQIKRVPRSGWNEDKYIEEALQLYKDEMSEDFTHMAVWNYLKDKPKWLVQAMKKKEVAKKEVIKKETAAAESSSSTTVVDIVDVADDDGVGSLRPIGQKKAKEQRNVALRQIEIDERTSRALQQRAETHKLNMEFKLFNSMGDSEEAKEWKNLVAQQVLLERKKTINEKKRAMEAEEARLKKKKDVAERLKNEVTPRAIEFEENKENVDGCEELEESSPAETFEVSDLSSSDKNVSPPPPCCAALDLCMFIDEGDDNEPLPLRNKCCVCKAYCHASCSKYCGQVVMCRLCDRNKTKV
jgi:hypothetical protein